MFGLGYSIWASDRLIKNRRKIRDESPPNVLRAIKKCLDERGTQSKFGLCSNILENSYLGGPKGRETRRVKYDITEFGLALLLLYINTPKAR
jgi:hypothetical protein